MSDSRPCCERRLVAAVDLDAPPVGLHAALIEVADLYVDHAVRFDHPLSMAHLNCPVAIPALAAEVVATALNTSVDTWDQSTSATLVEQALVAWTASRIGFGEGASGVFTSGGTLSNTHALALSRERARGRGVALRDLRVLASEQAHFSVSTAVRLLGLGSDGSGRDAVVPIRTDSRGRLDPAELAATLRRVRADGGTVMCVVATAGTTDLGAVDPLEAVAAVLDSEAGTAGDLAGGQGLARPWLHVDAAYGCGLLVSPTARHRLAGIERADSVTVDFHKSFFQPVACSALVVREAADLHLLAHHADYLNPAGTREPNLVDVSLQTTRRFDALKVWTTLRSMGADRIGQLFDRAVDLAATAYELASGRPEIEVARRPELSTLLFRYRPDGVTGEEADRLVAQIRSALFAEGSALLASTRLDGRPWLKITLLDPTTTPEDLATMLDLVTSTGETLVDAERALEPADREAVVSR
jgi:L-2,4-diaminobutyrate decarboxylase